MDTPVDTSQDLIPQIVKHVTGNRADTLARLRIAADDAAGNMVRFARRKKPIDEQYYAGMRDGLLRAITMLESE